MSRTEHVRPFPYFGAKHMLAKSYPPPKYGTIVEPFAGSAGYSCRYSDRKVILCERDPVVASVWSWLIEATSADVMALPILEPGEYIPEHLAPGARALIGFWCQRASPNVQQCAPSVETRIKILNAGSTKAFWGTDVRQRLADNAGRWRHWTLIQGSYVKAPNCEATWFIDPPYQVAGKSYRCSSREINFMMLGQWCRARYGQVIVCENRGATWLPFVPFAKAQATPSKGSRKSLEVVWMSNNPAPPKPIDRYDLSQ